MKAVLGLMVCIFFGFVLFLALSSAGFMLALAFHVFSGWQIAAGTFVGTIMVLAHVLFKEGTK